jgi:hypothetical protein
MASNRPIKQRHLQQAHYHVFYIARMWLYLPPHYHPLGFSAVLPLVTALGPLSILTIGPIQALLVLHRAEINQIFGFPPLPALPGIAVGKCRRAM